MVRKFGIEDRKVTETLLRAYQLAAEEQEEATDLPATTAEPTVDSKFESASGATPDVLSSPMDKECDDEGEDDVDEEEAAAVTNTDHVLAILTADDDEDEEPTNSQLVSINCAKCKKRGKEQSACTHSMCHLCCYETVKSTGLLCHYSVHVKKTKKRDVENEMISHYGQSKPRNARLYHFQEPGFTLTGQTVVVWCLHDFVTNPKWNKEKFETEMRQNRQQRSLRRRDQLRAALHVSDASSEEASGSSPTDAGGTSASSGSPTISAYRGKFWRYRAVKAARRFEQVRVTWEKKLVSWGTEIMH